jgi:adenosylcobinamide-phosphate synthase
MEITTFIACLIGLGLDLWLGDPRKMPHLVKLAGHCINRLEQFWLQRLGRSILSGALIWISLNASLLGAYLILHYSLAYLHPWLSIPLDAIVVFQSIAFTDLIKHVRAIAEALPQGIQAARERVSWIVGRDTSRMDSAAVCRAAIESGSENYNDSAIAPLFWLLIFGPAGALFFRLCNTLDAMIGHRCTRFEKIGKFSARADDVLNLIPARLCSLIIHSSFNLRAWWQLRADASLHPSWNAGWPEAAMAQRLGVVLGGEMYLNGQLLHTATMNSAARQPTVDDLHHCIHILQKTYYCSLTIAVLILAIQL